MRLLISIVIILVIASSFVKPVPVISITFDDSLVNQFEASRILDKYGFKGTFYVLPGYFGSVFEGYDVMNYSQVRDLYSRGHEIGCHTMSHINLSASNISVIKEELSECKRVLKEFNVKSFAYPFGMGIEHESIVKKYFSSARVLIQEVNTCKEFNIKGLIFVHERMNRLETLKEWISTIKRDGGWIVITIHGISDEPRDLIDITPDEFNQILEVINDSGIKVKTVSNVLEGRPFSWSSLWSDCR